MQYFADPKLILPLIEKYAQMPILWIDTEVADFKSRNPKLSLIQVLDSRNESEKNVAILNILHQPEIVDNFIEKIMLNPIIEKVFHNAKYDLKFLGKAKAKNVTCTLEIAKKIPYYLLSLPNLSLKSLTEKLCNIVDVDKSQQISDWGQRPLNNSQLNYAKLDPVYLYMVHQKLLHLQVLSNPNPVEEDIEMLAERYLELKQQYQVIESQLNHFETRMKAAMQAQNVTETVDVKMSSTSRTTLKVAFSRLAEVIQTNGMEIDFPITITQKLQKDLAQVIEQLPLQEEITNSWRLIVKQQDETEEL